MKIVERVIYSLIFTPFIVILLSILSGGILPLFLIYQWGVFGTLLNVPTIYDIPKEIEWAIFIIEYLIFAALTYISILILERIGKPKHI